MYKVFIGSLSYNTPEDSLTQLFSEIEGFENVSVITDQITGRSRGFAFATFASKAGADESIEKFNGYELDGFTLNIDHAKEKKRDGSAPRGGSRGGDSRGGFGGGRSDSRGGFGGSRGGDSRGGNGGGFGGGRSSDRGGSRW
jgi:RNA recognition motif-containing protein